MAGPRQLSALEARLLSGRQRMDDTSQLMAELGQSLGGIGDSVMKRRLAELERVQKEKEKTTLTPKEELQYSKDYDIVDKDTNGAFKLHNTAGEERWYKSKQKSETSDGVTYGQIASIYGAGGGVAPPNTKGALTVPLKGGGSIGILQKPAPEDKPRDLPADKVLSVEEGNSISKVFSDLRPTLDNNKDKFGPVMGRVNSANPYDERAQTIDSQMRTASQVFGKFMEGGVLRKEDEAKYRKMFPSLGDTEQVAKNKLDLAERMFLTKQQDNLKALEASRFNVGGVKRNGISIPAVPKILSGEKPKPKTSLLNSAVAADTGPHGPTVIQNGVTYTWNPKTKEYE